MLLIYLILWWVLYLLLISVSWSSVYSVSRYTRIPGFWTQVLGARLWTLEYGLRALDSGHQTLEAGPWTLNDGRWTLDIWLWLLNPGCRNLDAGCYTLDTELLTLDSVVDCFRTESEPSFWFCLIESLKSLWVWISMAIFKNSISTLSVTY